jgi:hypothetical protein
MKKLILLMILGLIFSSCSSTEEESSASGLYKWSFKLDGVLYEWQGNYLTNTNGGTASYSDNLLFLQYSKPTINNGEVNLVRLLTAFSTVSTGNFIFNSSTNPFVININRTNQQDEEYSTSNGGTINVNVSALSNDTKLTNSESPCKVIGTFSGTIKKTGSQTIYNITDGNFEAVRVQ